MIIMEDPMQADIRAEIAKQNTAGDKITWNYSLGLMPTPGGGQEPGYLIATWTQLDDGRTLRGWRWLPVAGNQDDLTAAVGGALTDMRAGANWQAVKPGCN